MERGYSPEEGGLVRGALVSPPNPIKGLWGQNPLGIPIC